VYLPIELEAAFGLVRLRLAAAILLHTLPQSKMLPSVELEQVKPWPASPDTQVGRPKKRRLPIRRGSTDVPQCRMRIECCGQIADRHNANRLAAIDDR
jgi:hypothetical protein